MTVKIKKIEISAFRGIPELELELEGKSLLLRGENGTGKSSLVDAIEYFFTGKVSHLEGVQGISLQRHGPHRSFKPEDVKIGITFDPGSVNLERSFACAPSPTQQLEDYFSVTQKGTFILRRRQLLTFIMTQPADRFRAIGSIIGVDPLDAIELEMMRLHDQLAGQVESKRRQIQNLYDELSAIIGERVDRLEVIVRLLNEKLKEASLPPIKSLEEASQHAEQMLTAVKKKAESSDKAKQINEILDVTKVPLITDKLITELNALNERIKPLLPEEIRQNLSLVGVLESGGEVIRREKMVTCPLCEQAIEPDELLPKIEKRLKTLRDLSDEASEIRKLSVPLVDGLKSAADRLKLTTTKMEQFDELLASAAHLKNEVSFLATYVNHLESARDLKNELEIQQLAEHKRKINELINNISAGSSQLLETIGLTEAERKVLEAVRLIEQVKSKTDEISKIQFELRQAGRIHEMAAKIYAVFSETKKAKIQEIYDSIQEDLQRFFTALHPDDPHKNIELTVALGRRASTELKIESFGRRGEDPRALASEGHLDSMGLCLFLAFVKKFNENCILIILDDVVTTIDANHRQKIAHLLLTEFGENQLVITTSDPVWYEQLTAVQQAYGLQGNFRNIKIIDWDQDAGPRMIPYKPRWEKIQDKLEAGDKSGAANDGRTSLEWLLKRICVTTNAPVPVANWESGMVSDLLPHARNRTESLIKEEAFRTKVSDCFTRLQATTILGNILSHDNPLATQVTSTEVQDFCERVRELHHVFLCPNCTHFLAYDSAKKLLICSNPRCQKPVLRKTK